jgi:tRNA(Met) C34 N-acetyltransferase TmcA
MPTLRSASIGLAIAIAGAALIALVVLVLIASPEPNNVEGWNRSSEAVQELHR